MQIYLLSTEYLNNKVLPFSCHAPVPRSCVWLSSKVDTSKTMHEQTRQISITPVDESVSSEVKCVCKKNAILKLFN